MLVAVSGISQPSYHADIAPLIKAHCLDCHLTDKGAPFSLDSYASVKRRAQQIVEVVESGDMPPWPPNSQLNSFKGQRGLTLNEIQLFRNWFTDGAHEGRSRGDTYTGEPKTNSTARPPDITVPTQGAYNAPADGEDVYRNFVIPIQLPQGRWIEAVRIHPGNHAVAHHAFLKIDYSGSATAHDRKDIEEGYSGMDSMSDAQMPDGHFLTWQPGNEDRIESGDRPWRLNEGADLVLQLHLRPSGKVELVRPEIELWFAKGPPTTRAMRLALIAYDIQIPANASDHVVRRRFTTPVDLQLFSILPHAHYLGKHLRGFATLPNGTQQSLIDIPRWNFDWQGDYVYKTPLVLPAGTTIHMEYHYDNSSQNPSNPNSPPINVNYGVNSTDEMAELWFQVAPAKLQDFAKLSSTYDTYKRIQLEDNYRYVLRANPADFTANNRLGQLMLALGKLEAAEPYLNAAADSDPTNPEPHYFLGIKHRLSNKLKTAETKFRDAVALDSKYAKAWGNLGLIAVQKGNWSQAKRYFRTVLRLNPKDPIAKEYMQKLTPPAK